MIHSTGLVLMVLEKTGGGSLEPSSGSGYTFTEACSVAVGGGGGESYGVSTLGKAETSVYMP